jgi:HAD superfamily hydrolase (TIGR01509 family)
MPSFAVIFDMDGVIVDSNPPHVIAIRLFCEKYGFSLTEEEMRSRVFGRTNRDWLGYLFGAMTEAQFQGYAWEKELLYRQIYASDIRPVAGVVEFVELLHQQQIPKAIGTSAPPENVTFTLEGTGLAAYFSIILDERFVQNGKPHPEIYLKTCAALGFEPENCIVFEDSLSGVQSALSAGCKVIGVATTHTAAELANTALVINDFVGLSLKDLEKLF